MKDTIKFIKGILILLLLGLGFSMLFSCQKEKDTTPPVTIIGEWETVSHLVYYPDTAVSSWQQYDWVIRDNGYALYILNNDTGYYTYALENDSIFFMLESGVVQDAYSLDLNANTMVWNEVIEYDPITDFTTERVITLQRK